MAEQKEQRIRERTCCACGSKGDKKGLVRIVRRPDGTVSLDKSGREPGRGAYVCADRACFAKAVKRRRFEQALKIGLTENDYERLQASFDEHVASGAVGEGAK